MRACAATVILLLLASVLAALAGCGGGSAAPASDPTLAQARAQSRPIGAEPRYTPPAADAPAAGCRPRLGPRIAVHAELFADDRVVVVPVGIGVRGARVGGGGRIGGARCYGPIVTLDPTGILLVRPDRARTVGDLFAAWGLPLGPHWMAGFRGRVRAYVDGRRRPGRVAAIGLARHANVVLQVGPFVPPHVSYTFPEGL
jgi:hypothetical protein